MKQETPAALCFLDAALAEARRRDLHRRRPPPADSGKICFCSNDYLGLGRRASPSGECGAGASRLVSGERRVHLDLEAASAEFVGQPAALAFTSGYCANLGLLAALAGPGDLIVSDALNHASIIDGARLSRARVAVVPHRDLAAVGRALETSIPGRAFVVTESYFSMDADSPDLGALRRLTDERGAALIVDEAHALGVLGPNGKGLCAQAEVRPDALIGTYGKAFGAAGAFVAGCRALVDWLWNRARPFVFSTGLSPVLAAAALDGLLRAQAEPDRRERALLAAARLRKGLAGLGCDVRGYGHIVPWFIGHPGEAVRLAECLGLRGVDVRAIRPPSVPVGTSRLRWTATADHGAAEIECALGGVRGLIRGADACPAL